MATETETQAGTCATHGTVDATREIPKMGFPFFWFAIVRAIAKRRPYKCPQCGEQVTV
jgi:hypothetical protein